MLFENLTEYQIEEYREIFKLFDKESEGVIKNSVMPIILAQKLKSVLSALGHHLSNS
jgi:Ca2+-binding EF-hand superfamily protein